MKALLTVCFKIFEVGELGLFIIKAEHDDDHERIKRSAECFLEWFEGDAPYSLMWKQMAKRHQRGIFEPRITRLRYFLSWLIRDRSIWSTWICREDMFSNWIRMSE